jgi:hypothetical protein
MIESYLGLVASLCAAMLCLKGVQVGLDQLVDKYLEARHNPH